jgi:purine-nucleoside phosphorylase
LPEGEKGKADDQIIQLCLAQSRNRKFEAISGRVWTTDALFRETRGKTKKYSKEGILAVEMEMSALLTVAAYRGIRLGGFMVVSDELASLKWKTGFLNPFFWHASKKAVRLAIEVCSLL